MQLFYDISLSRRHKGTPHGLARVEVSIAKALLENNCSVNPIWINDNQKIVIGESIDLHTITDGSASSQAAFANFDIQKPTIKTNSNYLKELKRINHRDRLFVLITYLISFFPGVFSKLIWDISKRFYFFLSRTKKIIRKMGIKNSSSAMLKNHSKNGARLNSNSLIIIAGNDWDRRILDHLPTGTDGRAKVAVVIYDLIPYEYPHFSVDLPTAGRYTYWIGDIAQRADYLFFISKFSQDRFNAMLVDRCIESQAKQMVVDLPPGILPAAGACEPEFSNEIKDGFILVVCTIESRKNHQVLLSALRLAISRDEEFPQLVFIGSPGWGTETLMREIHTDERLIDRIVLKSGISDNELRWLYEKCTGVAYPSIVEGFGLPVFESAVFKKPIVTSDIPVFDEIPHPLRVRVNPYSSEGWKVALQGIGSKSMPEGGWQEMELPTWTDNVKTMIAFMSNESKSW
jgi:glycosyltransferase involved in cell wall biosynthesis